MIAVRERPYGPSDYDGELGIHGLDIGPMSKRELFCANEGHRRVVIKVGGHMAWSGLGMTRYVRPCMYLIEDNVLVYDIEYDMKGAAEARKLAHLFIAGEQI